MENNVVDMKWHLCRIPRHSDHELQDLDDELDVIDKELSKLRQRLNACLKYKRAELKGRITKLTEQVEAEQKAITMAKNHNRNPESPKTTTVIYCLNIFCF
jgi:predicted nuclease with TOPRIM domain